MHALLCIAFIMIQDGIHGQNHDFRPTPIPLNEWHNNNRREGRAGTLHETFDTESPLSIAAVPAHYWEDALRHSVYLTLVKDKIKQLMTKDIETSDSKPGNYDSKEIEDQGLWNKIKNAPFKRLPVEEPTVGDVTIMAKGRLLEDKKGFSFAEDERTKETCDDDKCMQGVKAFWSVKRVRQREQETSPGKYHYELTFSVISQTPKKPKKPQESPIKTYTVRESSTKIIETPQEHRKFEARKIQSRRPERAIWFHRNIAPDKQMGRRQFFQGFDTLFSSLFSDDGSHDPPTKYKQNPYPVQQGYQLSKIGQSGVHTDHPIPYPYRPNPNKSIRPAPIPPINPIQQSYLDINSLTTANSNLYSLYPFDQRTDVKPLKTTRPAVLPTPLPPISIRDYSHDVTQPISVENVDNTTLTLDAVKHLTTQNKYKPFKTNYFPDHLRPPIYNAPPGVFVTMDKKPFKPMPPLKYLHQSKPNRPNRPIDFRPSPQVMDVQFSDPDSFGDTAFRPIILGYSDKNKTSTNEFNGKKKENKNRKPSPNGKKPFLKHEITKSQYVSTTAPEIITAQPSTSEEIETLDWANVLGAFTKTTPMVSQTESVRVPETTTSMATTVRTTTAIVSSTTEMVPSTSTTVAAPKKRTRPPPNFTKQEKIKKHKRITTTTSTTNAPEKINKRPSHDLIPEASSSTTVIPTVITKIYKESQTQTQNPTSSTSTTSTTTNKPTTTTKIPSSEPTELPKKLTTSMEIRNKSRFRQSTLILKGTSVKHDRWNTSQRNQPNTTLTPTVDRSSHRRKGSNFQGYMSSTPQMSDEGRGKNHADRTTTTTTTASSAVSDTTTEINTSVEETVDQYETNSVVPLLQSNNNKDETHDEVSESKVNTTPIVNDIEKPSIKLVSSVGHAKNKTKCKKKKQNIVTSEQPDDTESHTEQSLALTELITLVPPTARTGTHASTNMDESFNYNFDDDDDDEKPKDINVKELEENYDGYTKTDNEFQNFLNLLDGEQKQSDHDSEYDDDSDEDDDNDDDEDDNDSKLHSEDEDHENGFDDEPEHKKEFSFLDLMAMS